MPVWLPLLGGGVSLVLALLLVGLSLRYALWRGLLDAPGQRRSHTVPTPRGGGLGLLLAALPVVAWAWLVAVPSLMPAMSVALLLAWLAVMGIGWLDDHHNLDRLPRLGVHLLVSLVLAWVILRSVAWPVGWRIGAGLALLLATTWSINLHNFMDGIDGLLASQMLFCFAVLGVVAWRVDAAGIALACAALAGACIGFLHYNRAPARIFMGDVGSGTLGWLLAAVAALLWRQAPVCLWVALILASAFIIDATFTLLRRIWLGRRWYTAHREHAYQWLVRSGFSHGRVVLFYLGWDLLLALPVALAALRWPWLAPALTALVTLLGAAVHLGVRKYCLRVHNRRPHAAA